MLTTVFIYAIFLTLKLKLKGRDEDGWVVLFSESRKVVKPGISAAHVPITSEPGPESFMLVDASRMAALKPRA